MESIGGFFHVLLFPFLLLLLFLFGLFNFVSRNLVILCWIIINIDFNFPSKNTEKEVVSSIDFEHRELSWVRIITEVFFPYYLYIVFLSIERKKIINVFKITDRKRLHYDFKTRCFFQKGNKKVESFNCNWAEILSCSFFLFFFSFSFYRPLYLKNEQRLRIVFHLLLYVAVGNLVALTLFH